MAWRRQQRASLISVRETLPAQLRRSASLAIRERLRSVIRDVRPAVLGGYWPIRREFNPLGLLRDLHESGTRIALPNIVVRNEPLQFRLWRPGAPMSIGVYDIPYPTEPTIVLPEALLIPVLGFDAQRFRLGYGGGYYDRTLAALTPGPYAIGIAFESGVLASIRPLAHDIPMDCIVTEARTDAGAPRRG